jgi:hypothetical protein
MKGIQGVILSLLIIIHSPFSYFSCFGRPYSLAERVGATVQAIGPAPQQVGDWTAAGGGTFPIADANVAIWSQN